jgi:hypothetical protein
MTQVTVEAAEADTSVHDAGWVDAKKSKEVVEVLPEVGQEAAPLEEPRPQQDRPTELTIEAEQGAVVPPPVVQAVVPAVEASALPQGSTPALIDLTLDDSPVDKGKHAANVEAAKALDGAGTSVALGVTRTRCQLGGRTSPG